MLDDVLKEEVDYEEEIDDYVDTEGMDGADAEAVGTVEQ